MPTESIAYQKALSFARRIVKLCRHLNQEHQEYVLSKQIPRCGCSRKDFAAKIYIALKECSETLY